MILLICEIAKEFKVLWWQFQTSGLCEILSSDIHNLKICVLHFTKVCQLMFDIIKITSQIEHI